MQVVLRVRAALSGSCPCCRLTSGVKFEVHESALALSRSFYLLSNRIRGLDDPTMRLVSSAEPICKYAFLLIGNSRGEASPAAIIVRVRQVAFSSLVTLSSLIDRSCSCWRLVIVYTIS